MAQAGKRLIGPFCKGNCGAPKVQTPVSTGLSEAFRLEKRVISGPCNFFTKHMNSGPVFRRHLVLEVLVFTGEIHIKKLLLHFLESARYSAF
jgi:hypothetical protein